MSSFRFNLIIMMLGFIYMLSAFAPVPFVDELAQMHSLMRLPIGILAATPLFATFYLVWRRTKLLAGDEFQQIRLMRQMLFASTYALCYTAIRGFVDGYGDRPAHSSYLFGICWWYVGWFQATIMFRREDE